MNTETSGTSAADAPLRIDIVSDVVCPWCIVGWRQLERALARSGIAADVHWHPFELNPDMPPEGENLTEHVARKYGSTAQESEAARERLRLLGEELGFAFRLGAEARIRPTFDAHRLLHWAEQHGRTHALKTALFAAYFSDGRNIAEADVLVDACAASGLDPDEARAVLAEGRFADEVRERERFWLERGIRGVPAVVLDGKHLLSGAQGVERYAAALREVTTASA